MGMRAPYANSGVGSKGAAGADGAAPNELHYITAQYV